MSHFLKYYRENITQGDFAVCKVQKILSFNYPLCRLSFEGLAAYFGPVVHFQSAIHKAWTNADIFLYPKGKETQIIIIWVSVPSPAPPIYTGYGLEQLFNMKPK